MDLHHLPTLNASLNFLSTIFLLSGWRAIKKGKPSLHKKWMLCALASSILFLCSYLTYHILVPGVTRYEGTGILRFIYFSILLTHTPLAVLIVPFCLTAVIFAFQGKFEAHKRITRKLLPVWLYVSVTGVVIYLMLYVF